MTRPAAVFALALATTTSACSDRTLVAVSQGPALGDGDDGSAPDDDVAPDPTAAAPATCLDYVQGAAREADAGTGAPLLESGVYTIDPDGDGESPPFQVWCDMTTGDGVVAGGWTLVARSVAGGTAANFGWRQRTGSVNDDSAPYSLNAARAGFHFSELLVAEYTSDKTLGERVYKAAVPADLLVSYADQAAETSSHVTIATVCTLEDGFPYMLDNVGYTDRLGRFFLRDNSEYGDWVGLFPDGFALHYPGCDYSGCNSAGCLTGLQGMLLVR